MTKEKNIELQRDGNTKYLFHYNNIFCVFFLYINALNHLMREMCCVYYDQALIWALQRTFQVFTKKSEKKCSEKELKKSKQPNKDRSPKNKYIVRNSSRKAYQMSWVIWICNWKNCSRYSTKNGKVIYFERKWNRFFSQVHTCVSTLSTTYLVYPIAVSDGLLGAVNYFQLKEFVQ